jgi:hypothetical protein
MMFEEFLNIFKLELVEHCYFCILPVSWWNYLKSRVLNIDIQNEPSLVFTIETEILVDSFLFDLYYCLS